MLIIQRTLGVITAGAILGLAVAGYWNLQDANRLVADVIGLAIVATLLLAIFRLGK